MQHGLFRTSGMVNIITTPGIEWREPSVQFSSGWVNPAEQRWVTSGKRRRSIQLQLIRLPNSSASRDWVSGKRCLVAGLGPIGLLAALALRLRGGEVWGLDVVDASTVRPRWLNLIGGHYIDGRQIRPDHLIDQIELFDLIFEATGVPSLEFDLIDALAINGVYVVTGIPSGDRPLKIDGAEFMRRLVLRNQVVVGSVNASHDHFQLAVNDLVQAQTRWHEHVADLITHRH